MVRRILLDPRPSCHSQPVGFPESETQDPSPAARWASVTSPIEWEQGRMRSLLAQSKNAEGKNYEFPNIARFPLPGRGGKRDSLEKENGC